MMKELAERTGSRPRAIWLTVTILVFVLLKGTDALAGNQRPLLRLGFIDAAMEHEGVRRAAQAEVGHVFERADIDIEFVDAADLQRGASLDGLIKVIILPRDGVKWNLTGDVMGAAPVTSRQVAGNAVYVFHPVVLQTLAGAGGTVAELTRLQVGRAIGRVIVHELVHALAPARPHARRGLMMRSLGRAQLLGPERTLDGVSARAARRQLGGG